MSPPKNPSLLDRMVQQYLTDDFGRTKWADLDISNSESALRHIFKFGACLDFANAVNEVTGWPIYEIQWGTALDGDPDDVGDDLALHRVILHPSGRFLDSSGWTDRQAVLEEFHATHFTYQWMDEVDAGGGVFDIDYDLVLQVAMMLLPPNAQETAVIPT